MTNDILIAGVRLKDQINRLDQWIDGLEQQGRVKTIHIEIGQRPNVALYSLSDKEFLLGESIRAFALSLLQCQVKVLRRQFEELGHV